MITLTVDIQASTQSGACLLTLCKICQEPFTPQAHNQVYCGPVCKRKREADATRLGITYERRCRNCDRFFTTAIPKKQFCQPTCQREHVIRRQHSRAHEVPSLEPEALSYIKIDKAASGTRLVILSDTQIPFHDTRVLGGVSRFLVDWKPNTLILNGDIADCYELSNYDKSPSRVAHLQDEVTEVRYWLKRWREDVGPEGTIHYILGNHEARLSRFLTRRAPELAGLEDLTLYRLYGLGELNMQLIAYEGWIEYLGFRISHGARVSNSAPAAGMTARQMIIRRGGSGVIGHTHRRAQVSFRDDKGIHTWYEGGCLCNLRPFYGKEPFDWAHAFLYGEVHNNKLHLHLVNIYEDGFWAGGNYYAI